MVRAKAVFVAAVMFLFVVVAAPTLVLFARSSRGRVEGGFGAVIAAFIVSGLVWLCAPLLGAERPAVAGYAALAAAAVFVPTCLLAAALKQTCDYGGGPVGSHFFARAPSAAAVGWSDMEDEYAWILVKLVTRLDFRMPAAESRAARAKVDELLAALAAVPDYRGLARVSDGQSYKLLSGKLDPCHCYSYRPAGPPGERLGLLVFLHGHGHNYLFVVHALRALCDRARLALVAPTFGYGNWEAAGGVDAVERATRFGVAAFDPDPARVFLAGISQGGAGVGRAGAAHPDRFAGLVFLSPTMEPDVIGSEAFADGWRGRRVLVFHGDRDRNVHPRTVDAACERMEADGVKVTQHRDPDAGHFLFFARLDEVTAVIERWVREV